MADQDSGSKTELPTTKKLKDARKKGDVFKSQDVVTTMGFIFAIVILWLMFSTLVSELVALTEQSLKAPLLSFENAYRSLVDNSIRTGVYITAIILLPIVIFSLFIDFLQTGPVLTSEKVKPKLENLNIAKGLKKMFGMDNLIELLKSIVKTAVLGIIGFLAVKAILSDIILLPGAEPENVVSGMWYLIIRVFGWTSVVFILLMFLDASYQHHSFIKKMKMSIRDIRDELKDTEGDPMLKGARRDLGHEWAQEAPLEAAGDASVLVVNPVHVAVAILYDEKETRVPIITGKGEEELALAMREVANEKGVPVIRNEKLARALLASETEDNLVPRELFDIVAEVIVWSRSVKQRMSGTGDLSATETKTPGEDLSYYKYNY